MNAAHWMRVTLVGALASMVAACASIGRPEGGPRDNVPPEFVRSNPEPGSTGVDNQQINIFFDENIKLDDVTNKLVVSPAQKQMPVIRSNAKKITVELRDTLIPNTTYTLDFADAIRDLNEGNILDGFALDFATGDTIDSLRISGMVFEARTLEPAQSMVVGVYSNLSDTALLTLPMERVCKTNQYGQFTIRNLKPGTYRIFAIDDKNRDWHWDRSENIAFADVTLSPTAAPVEVADTLSSAEGNDSIVTRTAYHYYPDNVLLTWFNENHKSQYLRDYERTDRRKVTFKFGAPSDTLPIITILNGPRTGELLSSHSVLEARTELDSLVYWMRDTMLIKQDSLLVSARYLKTDSTDNLSWTTDTLKLFMKTVDLKAERDKQKEWEKKISDWEKKHGDKEGDTVPRPEQPLPLLEFKAQNSAQQDLNKPLVFEAEQPVERIDSTGWRLEEAVDSLWLPVADAVLTQDSVFMRRYNLTAKWKEGTKYRFTVDSLAIVDVYGVWNSDIKTEFTTKLLEDYGNVIFDISDISEIGDSAQLVVELLSKSDAVEQTVIAKNGTATFNYVAPGVYYARAFIDRNCNGKWDTGNVADSIQPEDVFYFPKKINLRKNWDVGQDWSLFDTAVDLQKPNEVKRNKPKVRDKQRNEGDYNDNDEDDEFGQDGYMNDDVWGNGSQYNNARRNSTSGRSSSSSSSFGGTGRRTQQSSY
jgi:uncharacterized protein (DUF2141 family)